MSVRFDERKSIQLAAIFLSLRGGEMKHLKLIKLMYLADREALKRFGTAITGDAYVSMDKGPVLSNVLSLIHDEQRPGQKKSGQNWSEFIVECAPHTVRLLRKPSFEALSDAEEELAEKIFKKYGHENRWKLVDLTHTFQEYRPPTASKKQHPIKIKDVLMAVGKTDAEAENICQLTGSVNRTKRLLALNG